MPNKFSKNEPLNYNNFSLSEWKQWISQENEQILSLSEKNKSLDEKELFTYYLFNKTFNFLEHSQYSLCDLSLKEQKNFWYIHKIKKTVNHIQQKKIILNSYNTILETIFKNKSPIHIIENMISLNGSIKVDYTKNGYYLGLANGHFWKSLQEKPNFEATLLNQITDYPKNKSQEEVKAIEDFLINNFNFIKNKIKIIQEQRVLTQNYANKKSTPVKMF